MFCFTEHLTNMAEAVGYANHSVGHFSSCNPVGSDPPDPVQQKVRCSLQLGYHEPKYEPSAGLRHFDSRGSKVREGLPHTASRLLSFGTCGCLAPVERVFHFTQEFRREKRFFQDICAGLDQFTQSRKLVTKAGYKQKLHLGASRTNSLCELNAVESGQA